MGVALPGPDPTDDTHIENRGSSKRFLGWVTEIDWAARLTGKLNPVSAAMAATKALPGILRFATDAEAAAGTQDVVGVTPTQMLAADAARTMNPDALPFPHFQPNAWEPTAAAGGVNIQGTAGRNLIGAGASFASPNAITPLTPPASGGLWYLVVARITRTANLGWAVTTVALQGTALGQTTAPAVPPFGTPSGFGQSIATTIDVPIAWAFVVTGNTTPIKVVDVRPHRTKTGMPMALSLDALGIMRSIVDVGALVSVYPHSLPSGGRIRRALVMLLDNNFFQFHGDISIDRSTLDPGLDISGYYGSLATTPGPILLRAFETRSVDSTDGYRATFKAYAQVWQQDNPSPLQAGTTGAFNTGAGFNRIPYQQPTGRAAEWDATANGYKAPRDGWYQIRAFVRFPDGATTGRNIGLAIGTTDALDAGRAVMTWQSTVPAANASVARFSIQHTRLLNMTKGQTVIAEIYEDSGTTSIPVGGVILEVIPLKDSTTA